MDQPPTVVFTTFKDVCPRATANGDKCHPMHNWQRRNFDFDHKMEMSSIEKIDLAL